MVHLGLALVRLGIRGIATQQDSNPSRPLQSVLTSRGLLDRVLRRLGLASVGGLSEVHPSRAVLGVSPLLMLRMRRRAAGFMSPEQLDRAVAVFAAELRIGIAERLGEVLHLPERLITSAYFAPAPLHFTLVDLLALDGHYCPLPPTVMRP